MSEGGSSRTLMDRLKDWWLVFGILTFLCGGVLVWWGKFTVYYLAEQSSVSTLTTLGTDASAMLKRLTTIDDRLAHIDATTQSQTWTNQKSAEGDQAFKDQLSHLSAIADANRDQLSKMHEELATQNQQIMFLLDPRGRPPMAKPHE